MNFDKQAEEIAEAFALKFIEKNFGSNIFIGSHIERVLADHATVIYQSVEDEAYFGAALQHEDGQQFIAINTFHPFRIRYFTAAHELWHLLYGNNYLDEKFNHERAADRFAAAIMLPETLTVTLWKRFEKIYSAEEAIIYIADLAEVPYVTVVRRLNELNASTKRFSENENEWLTKRNTFNIPESYLDQSKPSTRFAAYENIIKTAVSKQQLHPLQAANKVANFAPSLAYEYQNLELLRVQEESESYET